MTPGRETRFERKPCHVCGRDVAHYKPGGMSGNPSHRGSVPHRCPHGRQCQGGDKLFRWAHVGYTPNCSGCSERLRTVGRLP